MSKAVHTKILQALTDRGTWEDRQRVWYAMRHQGLARRRKPFEGAADLHYPLIDTVQDKFKPFYNNQVFGTQLIASFTPLDSQLREAQGAAEEAFDWLIRNETNFEEELDVVFDAMLLGGRAVLKARWSEEDHTVEYEAIDPIFLIVPKSTNRIEKADWVCHVKQLSVLDYQLETLYLQDEALVKRIKGGGEDRLDTAGREVEKATREGITYSDDKDTIVLFEVYVREKDGWRVHTFSPTAPESPVREPFLCPYKWRGKPLLPFVSYQFERKDRGWYSPRGVAERLAPFETYATKCWNSKADHMEFSTKPLFTSEAPLSNTGNFRFRPGDYLPPGTSVLQMPAPPVALDQEINNTRLIAQETIQVPDFGASEEGGPTKTATETNYVRSFASQGIQYRGRITFRSVAQTFRLSWALWVQYGGQKLAYVTAGSRKVLSPQALHDNYAIAPNGSPDAWNRQQRLQRSIARYQMFLKHPNVNQEELVKSVLEEDDPRLVKRLFISTQAKSANEAEDEAMEIVILMSGFPAAVSPGEDHVLRLRILSGKLQQLQMTGAPVDPIAKQRLQGHMIAHLQMLQQENPALAKQFMAAMHAVDPSAGGQPPVTASGPLGGGAPGADLGGSGAGAGPNGAGPGPVPGGAMMGNGAAQTMAGAV